MINSHYILQLLLYNVALHLFLEKNLKNYSYDKHVGVSFYVFLRGLTGQGNDGVFSLRPPYDAVKEAVRLLYNTPEKIDNITPEKMDNSTSEKLNDSEGRN